MADGVTTRLQKEVTQLQKDREKFESKIEGQLAKMGEKLHNDLQVGLADITTQLKIGRAHV